MLRKIGPFPKKELPFSKGLLLFSGNKNIFFSFSPPKKGREGQANKRSEGKDYAKINEKRAVEKGGRISIREEKAGCGTFQKVNQPPDATSKVDSFLKGKIKAIHQEAGGET